MVIRKNIRVILFAGVSPKYYLSTLQKKSIPYFDNIFISDPGHEAEWNQYGAKKIDVLPLSAGCPNTFQGINLIHSGLVLLIKLTTIEILNLIILKFQRKF